jgi:hypothetical protein
MADWILEETEQIRRKLIFFRQTYLELQLAFCTKY